MLQGETQKKLLKHNNKQIMWKVYRRIGNDEDCNSNNQACNKATTEIRKSIKKTIRKLHVT